MGPGHYGDQVEQEGSIMSQETRRFITLVALMLLLITFMAFEVHRHALAAIWPAITQFWDTYIRIYQK